MSSLVSRRACAATSSLLLAAVALSGCSLLGGGGSKSTDISKLPNIPQGQKQQLVQQMQSASGDQKKQIAEKAVALNNMVGAQLVGVEPVTIAQQTFKLDPKGQTVVNKNDTVYQMMSATDFWRLGNDTMNKTLLSRSLSVLAWTGCSGGCRTVGSR